MPIVRLAKISDYVEFSINKYETRTYYKVSWCETIGPGNPTADPAVGLVQFNNWQLQKANSELETKTRADKLNDLLAWCFNTNSYGSRVICSRIVHIYKNNGNPPKKPINRNCDLTNKERALIIQTDLLSGEIVKMQARRILELQNMGEVNE